MKIDAMDKFNLRNDKKEVRSVFLLFLILIVIIIILFFIIFLSSLKDSEIKIHIEGVNPDNIEHFKDILKDKSCLQMILPNFKKKLEQIYYIQKAYIFYIPLKNINIKIIEKKPYCIIYDRERGIFYQVNREFIILRMIFDISLLKYNIISTELEKVYKKGEKLNFTESKVDLYNEDYQLSEIIVDKENIFGIPINHDYLIYFGSFLDRLKMENLKFFFSLLRIKKEDERFNKINYIDMTYPDIARVILK